MALAQQEIEQIEQIIYRIIETKPDVKISNVRYDLELRERSIHVETELKHQRELMLEGFKQMDKRFDSMQLNMDKRFDSMQLEMDKRFELVDKRFESMQLEMNRRFELVDKRFESMQLDMDRRFELVDKRFEQIEKHFEQVDKRFDSMQLEMNKRFEQQHQDVMNIHQEIKALMRWGFGSLVGVGGLIVALLRLI